MLAYRYDTDTKEFIGLQYAQKDPLDKGYLLPANCTFKEPPDKVDGYVQVYDLDNDTWQQVRDHRSHYEVHEGDFTFDIVKYIGEAKEGYIFVADEVYVNYLEDNDRYKIIDHQIIDIIDTEEYREIKRRKEQERIANLRLTRREVFLALYRDKGITPDQIRAGLTNEEAIIEFDYASDYYRGNPLITMVGTSLGYASSELDYLFEHKEFPDKEEIE